ncbi:MULTISPECIES: ABC transporter permease [unclassified Roseivivax]|uniref:ABC transporter permease n=1 Tax=Roseivivax sp. GX 12232 TaxID=2900547 RepID=UPI001E39BBCE|nr:ABC transporter permease [Roseivivax sp. GX 12232]MCE0504067.1 ABC transporter permease [Roseivivax sp. GX 12232]
MQDATPDSDGSGSETVAAFAGPQGLRAKLAGILYASPAIVPLIVLIVAVAIFGLLLGDRFFTPFALTLILQQVAIIGIVASAQSLVILTAGIDLSVGAIMILSSVIMGKFTFDLGLPPALGVLCGLLCGLICGSISGYLVAYWKLPPFIVTLGMWQIVLAANFLYSGSEVIRSQDIAEQAPLLQFFGRTIEVGGAVFTYGVILLLVLVAVLTYVLSQTAWGRHVYAVGDDPGAAELSGVNVRGTLISVYALAGLICAFAGWALIGRIGSVSPQAGQLANIESITAVVIGGISLFGGRGSVAGTLFGALIVGVFTLGLRLLGADVQWTYLLIGVLIIAAVTVDQRIRRASL